MLVKKKSQPARKIVKTAMLLAPLVILVYIIFFTPILKIQAVEVKGVGASTEEINEYLGAETVGSNIIFWSPKRIIKEDEDLTKKLATFKIDKEFWKRKIVINISERHQKLIWCFKSTDSCFWIDEDGVLFDKAPKTSGNLIYAITDEGNRKPEIGARVIDESLWLNLNKIITIIADLNIAVDSLTIEDIKFRELIADSVNGPKIIFGLNIDPEFMRTALTSLKENKTSWQNTYSLNLTVHGRAYTIPR